MNTPTAVIADDEPLLRAELRDLLAAVWPALQVVGEAGDGRAAVAAVQQLSPSVVFMDINMPRVDGMAAAQQLRAQGYAGELVFVTAYEQHALRAFEQRALDYLVKPLEAERLQETAARLQARMSRPGPAVSAQDAAALVASLRDTITRCVEEAVSARPAPEPAAPAPLRWLRASRGSQLQLIAVDDVACFRAVPGYTQVLTREGEHLINEPLKQLLPALDPSIFVQVHRSAIVNLRFVARMQRVRPGQFVVELRHGLGEVAATRSLADVLPPHAP